MAPKFGTSGLRGLVTELTPDCVNAHVAAFAATCPIGTGLYVAEDLRPSSPAIAQSVAAAARSAGLQVHMCGPVPTPALALCAMNAGAAAIMVTGSHIPADRNGLKFYTPVGEITKDHEQAIVATVGNTAPSHPGPPIATNDTAHSTYLARYVGAYGQALAGTRIGVYAHSAVGRDLLADILTGLGAEVVALGFADSFIPVDTEAVDPDVRAQLQDWAAKDRFDAIVSTDGDGDRPLVTDENGQVIVGDVLGQIAAAALGAETVVTPVSSNTGVDVGARFQRVIRTRIGSPFVIAGMGQASGRVVGYEANGGFLLGFAATGPAGALPPLMTRDALLPIIAVLAQARGVGLAALVAREPARFTAADRLQDIPTDRSQDLVSRLTQEADDRRDFLAGLDSIEAAIDLTDGLRMTLKDGRILHLRPSGNAPELRLNVEADSPDVAEATLARGLAALRAALAS